MHVLLEDGQRFHSNVQRVLEGGDEAENELVAVCWLIEQRGLINE